jgi:hypothetical protein
MHKWHVALVCVVLAIVAVCGWVREPAVAAPEPAAQTIVRAHAFILEDANGKARAMLCMNGGGPRLILLDAQLRQRAAIFATEDMAGIGICDTTGDPRCGMMMSKADGPVFTMDLAASKARAGIIMSKGAPSLVMTGADGKSCLPWEKQGIARNVAPRAAGSTGREFEHMENVDALNRIGEAIENRNWIEQYRDMTRP